MWTTGQMATPSFDVAQARGPVETGVVPVMVSEESWMKDYGND